MRTMPLSATVAEEVVDFEAICRTASRDYRITEDEARTIMRAGRALGRDAGLLAETVDLIGTLARGTEGVLSNRAVEKMARVKRRAAVVIAIEPEPLSAA